MLRTIYLIAVTFCSAGIWLSSIPANADHPFVTNAVIGNCLRYQGRLNHSNDFSAGPTPANGTFDFRFRMFDHSTDTNLNHQVGTTIYTNLWVTNGLFGTLLDFGDIYNGAPRYLDIGVRPAGVNTDFVAYTALQPRNPITPTPYAQWARKGGSEVLHVVFNQPPDLFHHPLIVLGQRTQWGANPAAGISHTNFVNYSPSSDTYNGLPGAIFARAFSGTRESISSSRYETNRFYFESRSSPRRIEASRFLSHLTASLSESSWRASPPAPSLLFQLRFEVWRIGVTNRTRDDEDWPARGYATAPQFNRVVAGPAPIGEPSFVGQWRTVPLLPPADLTIDSGEFLVAVIYSRSDISLPTPGEQETFYWVCNVEVEATVSSLPAFSDP